MDDLDTSSKNQDDIIDGMKEDVDEEVETEDVEESEDEDDKLDIDEEEIDEDDEDDNDDDEQIESNNSTSAMQPEATIIGENNDEDDIIESDDEDEYSEDVFKKIESNFDNNIAFIHPQTTQINSKELDILTKVVKNKHGIIIDNLHRTVPILSKYEYTKILGQRISQLNQNNKSYLTKEKYIDNIEIAKEEIKQKILPIIVQRPLASGGSEYWKLQDLQLFAR